MHCLTQTSRTKSRALLFLLMTGLLIGSNACKGSYKTENLSLIKHDLEEAQFNSLKKEDVISRKTSLIDSLEKHQKNSGSINPWASLLKAKLLYLSNEHTSALQALESIPESSAASLDASLLKIRIGLDDKKNTNSYDRELVLLEAQIRRTKQVELQAELNLVKAQSHEKRKDFHGAMHLYQNLRSQYAKSWIGKVATQKIHSLTKSQDSPLAGRPLAETLEEARILIDEKEFQSAYLELQNAKLSAQKDTPAYHEIQLEEVAILLSSGRTAEAKVLLRYLGDHSTPVIGVRALFMLAETLLSEGKLEEFHTLYDETKNRTAFSSFKEDFAFLLLNYYTRRHQAQISIEKSKTLLIQKTSLKNELLLIRRLAWMHLLLKDSVSSLTYFTRLLGRTTDIIQLMQSESNPAIILDAYFPYSERSSIKRRMHSKESQIIDSIIEEVIELHAHALYWSARLELASGRNDRAKELLQNLFNETSISYYRKLAEKDLKEILPPAPHQTETCTLLPDNIIKNENGISDLISAFLYEETKRELVWKEFIPSQIKQSETSPQSNPSRTYTSKEATVATALLIKNAGTLGNKNHNDRVKDSISYTLKKLPPWRYDYAIQEEQLRACLSEYQQLLSQHITQSEAKKLSETTKINVALLEAIINFYSFKSEQAPKSLQKKLSTDFSQTQQLVTAHSDSQNNNDIETLYALFSNEAEIKEYVKLRKANPQLTPEMLLELSPDEERKKTIKAIYTLIYR